MEDFVVLWVWGFCGDSHRFFCGYGMGMGIEIQSHGSPAGWVVVVKLSKENIVDMECLMVVAMATNFGTKIAITGFVRTNMSY